MERSSMKKGLLATSLLAGLTGSIWSSALAQETDGDAPLQVVQEESDEEESRQERVVVTGSRIQRSEFNSIKPVQVISGEVSRDIGLVDAASLLQESTAATGLQIDTTFNGFVLDNGPGASTIDLRGLGAARTLVLVNGRRLGASGVEGAPGVPDLNLIPSSLIDRIDVLLDGASSVYGSDAVAGVANVILRKDFDGFEVEGSWSQPLDEGGGGDSQFVSFSWGASNDRGFMGFGAEFNRQNNLALRDRPDVFGDCPTPYEITSDGSIRTVDISSSNNFGPGLTTQPCNLAFGINRIWIDPLPGEFGQFGSLYYTPGTSNSGVPNYTESGLFGANLLDANGNLAVDILAPFYQQQGYPQDRTADVQANVETFSAFTYGEYNLGFENNTTAFFEALFSQREFKQRQEASLSFRVATPGDNPFNPCNPDGVRGVDCGDALNQTVAGIFGAPLQAFGLPAPVNGPRAIRNEARLNLRPEDQFSFADVAQFRIVGGLRGDLPVEDIGLENWTWETSISYDRADGQSRSTRLSDTRLALSLATTIEDPNNPGQFICGLDTDGDGIPEQGSPFAGNGFNDTPACVPVDAYAPSLYALGGGDLATAEEYDYLISDRTFNTVVEQTILQAVFTGDLFDLPGGTAAGVVGFEYREDSLDSLPDDVARLGLNVGFFSDRGATGRRDLREVFAEVELPLVANQPLVDEITVNASARFTDESNFGSATTYSIGGRYRPVNFLTFNANFGTSFRAPNLREQFIQGQSGFLGLSDPCLTSDLYFVPDPNGSPNPIYDRSLDPREDQTLENCRLAGVDPERLGLNTGVPSTEVFTFRGSTLEEETSEAFTGGFVIEQPFFDVFDLTMNFTYYDIQIDDTIIELGAQGIVNDCYVDQPSQASALCDLIRRNSTTGFLQEVDTPFINQDSEKARGLDFGLLYEQEFVIGDQEVDIGVDMDINHTFERTSITRAPGSDPVENQFEGRPYNPEWRGQFRAFGDYGDWRLTWNTTWTGATQARFSDVLSANGDTCLGIDEGDVDCRDIDYLDDYFLHNASVRYNRDTWTVIAGMRNVFDEAPQLVDAGEVFVVPGTNVPFGQDYFGRTVFVNVAKSF